MKNLNMVRQRIVIALVILGLIDAVALTYLLLPSRTDMSAQREALNEAEQEARRLTQTVAPLRDIQTKLRKADVDINDFYKNRLASRYSEVVDEIGKVASNSRVAIGAVTYKESPTPITDLQLLDMQAEISGPYVDLAKFVNALERDKIFFIIDSVSLSGGQKEGGGVRLALRFETYLRMKTEESS
jgi:type IV pilus assembly protein PilO